MPKKSRVESIDRVEEAAPAAVHLARRVGIRVVERVDVPAIRRHLADRVAPVAQQPPERVGIVGAAREAAAHADDRDRLGGGALQPLDLQLQPFDAEARASSERDRRCASRSRQPWSAPRHNSSSSLRASSSERPSIASSGIAVPIFQGVGPAAEGRQAARRSRARRAGDGPSAHRWSGSRRAASQVVRAQPPPSRGCAARWPSASPVPVPPARDRSMAPRHRSSRARARRAAAEVPGRTAAVREPTTSRAAGAT